jgi:hypothetical protein
MPRLRLELWGAIVPLVLVLPIFAQGPTSEDETSPAILKFVRERLAASEGLRPADGVEVRETKFFRGTLRVRGTVRSADQLEKARRSMDALRGEIGSNFDVRIMNIDYTGLTVGAGGRPGEPERLKPMPSEAKGPSPEVWEEPFYYVAPPPPAKERRRHHWRKKDEPAENAAPYGEAPHWVPLWGAGWGDGWGGWTDLDDGPNAFSDPDCKKHKHHHWWQKHKEENDP